MNDFFTILGFVNAGLYLFVSVLCGIMFKSKNTELRLPVRVFAINAVVVHLLYLLQIVIQFKRLPLASVFEALTFMAFILAVIYIFIQYTSRETGTGIFVYPVIFILQVIAASNLISVENFNPVLASPYFALHTVPSILGYAAFLISMKYSAMYLMMNNQIQTKKFGLIYEKLPSLDGLDRLNKKAVLTGFCLLTIGIVTGMIWAETVWKDQNFLNPKVVASFVIWIVYGVSIQMRYLKGWQGKRAAFISVLGGMFLLLSFFVI